jgi:hypothetical protein
MAIVRWVMFGVLYGLFVVRQSFWDSATPTILKTFLFRELFSVTSMMFVGWLFLVVPIAFKHKSRPKYVHKLNT